MIDNDKIKAAMARVVKYQLRLKQIKDTSKVDNEFIEKCAENSLEMLEQSADWLQDLYEKLNDGPDIDELLEHFGWTMICESPLELKHDDGSFASGQAASYLIEGLKEEFVG
jgi:hypothetical protein